MLPKWLKRDPKHTWNWTQINKMDIIVLKSHEWTNNIELMERTRALFREHGYDNIMVFMAPDETLETLNQEEALSLYHGLKRRMKKGELAPPAVSTEPEFLETH